mgnify:CR=1 FL=1
MKEIGYADTTSKSPHVLTQNPVYKEEVGRIRSAIVKKDEHVFDKVAGVMLAGLGAMETKFFQHNGIVRDSRNVVSWPERRQYAELIAKVFGELVQPEEGRGMSLNVQQLAILVTQARAARGLPT